MSHLMSIPF